MSNKSPGQGSGLELTIVGRTLGTIGMVSVSICFALLGAVFEEISAVQRTVIGLSIASLMVVIGQLWWNRSKDTWFATTLMASGYGLAYFFSYATYYVPGLSVLSDPYLTWGLGLALGAAGTLHGARNKSLRWFSVAFTMMITGHALFHALTSGAVVTLFGVSIKVAALGCFASVIWCGALSAIYKRLERRYQWKSEKLEESASWLMYRVAHELYFVVAAVSAMALPLFLSSLADAPFWWSVQAPILLAISWRTGNIIKHIIVGAIWLAAAAMLLANAHGDVSALVMLSAPIAGLGMGLAYRFLPSKFSDQSKVGAYCVYLYGAILLALAVPLLQLGLTAVMPYWLVAALVLCGLGLLLKDPLVHDVGCLAGAAGLALFAYQWNTWDWALVGPVIAGAYGLSVAYSRIARTEGWKRAEFIPFGRKMTVTVERAQLLEQVWSLVGFATLVAATLLLLNRADTVNYWALEGLCLIAFGFQARKLSFRVHGLLAFALAGAKLVIWDISGAGGHNPEAGVTVYKALQFGIIGAAYLAASYLYHRELMKLEAQSGSDEPPTTGAGTGEADKAEPGNDA